MPRKVFVAGEILTASDVNTNLMDQSVMVFDDATARTTAIPTPVEGMVTYLEDVGGAQGLEVFDGAVFTPVAIEPDPPAILQVVSTAKTNAFTTASTTFTTVTDLTATITPASTSSKVLIVAELAVGSNDFVDNRAMHWRLSGGNSSSFVGDSSGSRVRNIGSTMTKNDARMDFMILSMSFSFLDSPSTTAATTYEVQVRSGSGGTIFVNRNAFTTDGSDFGRGASSITVMEVAG